MRWIFAFKFIKLHTDPVKSCAPYQGSNSIALILSVGARVFARWTNGLYYRGFVARANSSTVFIRYDDGDTITLHKIDPTAVILDKLPCYSHIKPGQRVIGFWPGRTRYYPGVVTYKRPTGLANCYQKAVYYVVFDDGDRRMQDFNQIRIIPCMTTETYTNQSV